MGGSPAATGGRRRPRPLPELILVVTLYFVYKMGRLAANGHVSRAFANAASVWHLERILHLPSEVTIQHALLHSDALTRTTNVYYAWVHFPATITFLIWIYLFRPERYVPLRRLMAVVTAIALAVHLAFPLAPPRMLPGLGLIDTAAVYGPSVYGPPSTDTLSNQYAAMPSLHVGWALIVAIGLIQALRTRWRWLWLLYPATTFAVVLATANHYWLDGLVAIAIIGAVAPLPGILGTRRPAADIVAGGSAGVASPAVTTAKATAAKAAAAKAAATNSTAAISATGAAPATGAAVTGATASPSPRRSQPDEAAPLRQ